MKKLVLLSVLFGALPISMMAQDDLYFTPKKSDKTVKSTPTPKVESEAPTYYSGSNRNIDEYNRRGKFGSYFEKIGTDSLGNDIIEFHSSAEDVTDTLAVYPGTKVEYDVDDDYYYSRRMSRFDDFYWYDPWFRGPYYGWHSPWWYSRWGWYDPWYYSYGYNGLYGWYGWYDWYDPYYYSWYGWGSPYRWGWYGGWSYSRPLYVSTYRVSPGNSRSTALYNRRTYTGNRGISSGTAGSRNWGNRSVTGNYSSNNVNRGYRRGTTSSSSSTRVAMPSSSPSTRSSGSFGSSSRSSGGSFSGGVSRGGGGSVGGGGGASHRGRR
ncbi:MAG: hypothetical protein IJ891_06735 [Prevotella sp.]|nr:hypothetical protein [Prevotella sp.]